MQKKADQKLYLVSTPIGHLGDMTFRAVETLKSVELILAEDTRTTRVLLNRYEISKKMSSFNSFHESSDSRKLVHVFSKYNEVAYVSENGTPAISDPGVKLVNFCYDNGIVVIPIPGCNAAITALSVAGFPTKNFLFYGFLPNKKGKRKNILKDLLENEKKTIVFYESPYRVMNLLENLAEIDPNLEIFVGREMTKKFEEFIKKTVKEVLQMYENVTMRGEFVVIVNNR